ncbi:MAG: Hpt domain-containing protein, partial [Bacteroidota bacterium]
MDTSTLRLHPASAFIPMDELRALYRTLLPDHRDRLDALRAQVQAEAASAEEREAAWAEILREAHTLKGSGGQFGFPEITDAALALRQAAPDARPALLNALYVVVVAAMESEAPAPDSAPVSHSADTQRPMAQRPLSVPSTTARHPVAMQSDASQTDASARTEEATTCKGRVLVVEDDPLIASVICNTLQRRGYAPTHCDLGTRALALLYEEGQPCDEDPS